ncbi:helix-turn-helix domain-containing protein [Rhodococcus marinonascens]|uniref:helix-turn-helix domain-containing protein n=1 Tax=Rhodococcus marinonascens TaxID=38311 RepID=UPI000932DC57|nr:helix-turn-helix domain-containing protein [Rhodococcus marinonascens]
MVHFSEKLHYLFANVHPKDRGPFTAAEVVRAIQRDGGTLSDGYLSQLLNGKTASPGLEQLMALAKFFRVPLDYFADDDTYQDYQQYISWLRSLRESEIPTRARSYNPFAVEEPPRKKRGR